MSSGVTAAAAASALSPSSFASRSRSRSPSSAQKTPETRSPSHHGLRSVSPNPKRISETRRKQNSFELNGHNSLQTADLNAHLEHKNSDLPEAANNKYENVSDNGSEISDEGYRSLGLIQNSTVNKRASVHSQVSNEDAENSGKSSDSFIFHSLADGPDVRHLLITQSVWIWR